MLNVYVVGCNGQMGKLICKLIKDSDNMNVVGGYDYNHGPDIDDPDIEVSDSIVDLEDVDVIIDFSRPSVTIKVAEAAVEYNVPMVIATTGFTDDQEATIEEISQSTPIFKILSNHVENPTIFAKNAIKCANFIANIHEARIYTTDDLL